MFARKNSGDAMGGPGGAGKGRGFGKSWLEHTRDRLEGPGRQSTGSGDEAVPEEARASVRARAGEIGGGRPGRAGVFARVPDEQDRDEEEAVEPVATVSPQDAHTAALLAHRMSTGRRASGFEPQRNTFFVCGRPVQVNFQTNQKSYFLQSGVTGVADWFER